MLPELSTLNILSLYLFFFAMAVVIDVAQKAAAFLAANSDLKFLLDREGVDEDFQAKLYHVGVVNVKQFAAFAEDRADLRKITKDNFEIDMDVDMASRVKVSKIVVAWDVAKARSAKQAEIEGESQCRRVPKDIGASDFQAMRESFETRWWELEDKRVPGKSYMEKKLDEVEKNELKAELLSEVVSQDEDDPDSLKIVWSVGGELKAVKVGAKVSLPGNPEELRSRITLLGAAWIFMSSQQTHTSGASTHGSSRSTSTTSSASSSTACAGGTVVASLWHPPLGAWSSPTSTRCAARPCHWCGRGLRLQIPSGRRGRTRSSRSASSTPPWLWSP